jgi:hypothetical protein
VFSQGESRFMLVINARGTLGPFPAYTTCSGISLQISSVYLLVI